MQWVRPDLNPEQLQQDAAQCRQEAWREASFRSFAYRPFAPSLFLDPWGRRLVGWPHSSLTDPFGHQFLEEARLADFCMRSKGYELAPVEPKK
jgi:hypothetical protein